MKTPTVAKLKKKLDTIYSQYVRLSNSNFEIVSCVTCGIEKPWKEMQCGHYVSRTHNATRFDEQNTHPQCYGCNVGRGGNYPKYALFLVQRYGAGILEDLDQRSKEIKRFTVSELEEMITDYKAKLADLQD